MELHKACCHQEQKNQYPHTICIQYALLSCKMNTQLALVAASIIQVGEIRDQQIIIKMYQILNLNYSVKLHSTIEHE